jgi:hypothetical protein
VPDRTVPQTNIQSFNTSRQFQASIELFQQLKWFEDLGKV